MITIKVNEEMCVFDGESWACSDADIKEILNGYTKIALMDFVQGNRPSWPLEFVREMIDTLGFGEIVKVDLPKYEPPEGVEGVDWVY